MYLACAVVVARPAIPVGDHAIPDGQVCLSTVQPYRGGMPPNCSVNTPSRTARVQERRRPHAVRCSTTRNRTEPTMDTGTGPGSLGWEPSSPPGAPGVRLWQKAYP